MANGNASGSDASVEGVASEQRAIQSRQDQKNTQKQHSENKDAVQPAPPLPGGGKLEGQAANMGRSAQPEALSPAYVFLASAVCSSYITGILLPVTGSVGE
jgi:NAD(P)-dependent dehydrogenase (short-subunit alcohol dehydrogenase family)